MSSPFITFLFEEKECKCGRKFLFKKTEAEAFNIGIDYVNSLPEGVFITSAVATAIDRRTGLDATATVLEAATVELDDDGNLSLVCIPVKAGTKGHSYKITVVATLDDAFSILESELEFNVK